MGQSRLVAGKVGSDLKQAPLLIRKPLFVPLLANKLQERARGGLKPEIKRRFNELAASFNGDSRKAGARLKESIRIKP